MSFWKSLFGGGSAKPEGPAKPHREIDHNGFRIAATPYAEGGQYQVCGVISKEVGGEMKEHKFIRADRFATMDEAAEFTIIKGRQIVDMQGERVFG